MDRNLSSDYDRVSRVSIDSLINDMYCAIEKLEETVSDLEKEVDSLKDQLNDCTDTIASYEAENEELKEQIQELEKEKIRFNSPNKPVDFFQL